jgi:uncharacterized cupin superfamily protein
MMARAHGPAQRRSFSNPDEVRSYSGLRIEVMQVHETVVTRSVHQPGWRWSESIWPLTRGSGCPQEHLFYVTKGRMKIVMNDGTELEFGPGDMGFVPAGHDALVLGTEPCEIIEFGGDAARYLTG